MKGELGTLLNVGPEASLRYWGLKTKWGRSSLLWTKGPAALAARAFPLSRCWSN